MWAVLAVQNRRAMGAVEPVALLVFLCPGHN